MRMQPRTCPNMLLLGSVLVAAAAYGGEPPTPDESPSAAVPRTLDLETAMGLALRDSPTLKAASARVEQAKAGLKQARSAFFPTVMATGGISKTWMSGNAWRAQRNGTLMGQLERALTPTGGADGSPQYASILYGAYQAGAALEDEFTTYTAALSAQWRLFDGFAREFSYAAAKFGAKESEAGYLEAKRLLLAAVAGSYFGAALAREDITIAQADEAFNLRLLKEAQARRRVGAGSLSDELNFQVRTNRARAALIRAENVYATAMIGLAQLLGLPDGRFPEGTVLAPLSEKRPGQLHGLDEEALVTYALTHRPDVLLGRHAVGRTDAVAKAGRGAFFPSVQVSASKAASLQDDPDMGTDDFATTLGVDVSYTLFAGGRNRAALEGAKAAREEAKHNLNGTELAVAAAVRDALERLRAAQAQLDLQRANATLVQKNRDLVEKEYDAGQASLVRLNEAQRDLIAAQAQLALARVGLRGAWQDLKAATGEILGSAKF